MSCVHAPFDFDWLINIHNRDANDAEIKVAYRKLALKFHPDKNPSAEATAIFQEIQEANSVSV